MGTYLLNNLSLLYIRIHIEMHSEDPRDKQYAELRPNLTVQNGWILRFTGQLWDYFKMCEPYLHLNSVHLQYFETRILLKLMKPCNTGIDP